MVREKSKQDETPKILPEISPKSEGPGNPVIFAGRKGKTKREISKIKPEGEGGGEGPGNEEDSSSGEYERD